MNQNEIVTATVAILICGMLAGVLAIPLIGGIGYEYVEAEYNDESDAEWLRLNYATGSQAFNVAFENAGATVDVAGQTGLTSDMIVYADNNRSIVMREGGTFVIVDAVNNDVIADVEDLSITNGGGRLTINGNGETLVNVASPAWAYYPDSAGHYAFFASDKTGVKIAPENNPIYAGTFAGVWAYNDYVIGPDGVGDLGLSLDAEISDDEILNIVWDKVPADTAQTITPIDTTMPIINPGLPSIIDDPESGDDDLDTGGNTIMSADPSNGTRIGDLYYTFSGTNATVIGYSSTIDWATFITIPDTVTYNNTTYTVTSIGSSAFSGCTNLALTSLPDGVTSISSYAFRDCTNLALTSLPAGVTSISSYAFRGCTNLALTSLPAGVTIIGNSVFSGCTNLTLTSLPAGVTIIGNSAFSSCTNLALTSLPAGVTSIGNSAFARCYHLSSMIIQSSPTIDEGAFYDTSIREVLNLGSTEITTTSYGLNANEVRDNVPAIGYIVPLSYSEAVQHDGPTYDVIGILPIVMLLGVVMIAVYWGASRFA